MEKIGYPELCVNKTLLEEYYHGVSKKLTGIHCFYFLLWLIFISKCYSKSLLSFVVQSYFLNSLSNDVLWTTFLCDLSWN